MRKEMRYAYEVYREQSFSRAARNLYISQPALSAVIKKLEAELHQPLFDRSTNPIGLTPAGLYYMQNVEQIMEIEARMQEYFDDLSELKTGSLRIGGTSFFCSCILPERLREFSVRYPGIHLELTEGSDRMITSQLVEGKLDLIFDSNPLNEELVDKVVLYDEEIVLAVPASWEINEELESCRFTFRQVCDRRHRETERYVSLSRFAELPFLFLTDGNDLFFRGLKLCRQAGFTPKLVMCLDQMDTLYHLARAQFGAAFLRDNIMPYEIPTDQLYFYRLNSPLRTRQAAISCKKNRYLNSAMTAFIEYFTGSFRG